jgi:prepilin-type N-terminal cleavage/methylation domain-containing protein
MQRSTHLRGFSLLETMIALVLVAFAMTALVLAFGSSSKYGVLGRRQASAVAVARSFAGQLSIASYADARLINNNNQNDASFADPNGMFALPTLPTGGDPDAPDSSLGTVTLGSETYEVYVNVSPLMDPVNITLEQGRQFAVIVRYKMGDRVNTNEGTFRRAVVLGYRYNPANMGVGQLPL